MKVGEVLDVDSVRGYLTYMIGPMSEAFINPHEIALMIDRGFLEESDGKWMPMSGEKYWFIETKHTGNFLVSRENWYSAGEDVERLKIGNCFQTKELAEAKLVEIKEVLRK